MTVVYGDNRAGKTSYTRILKSACRARGGELILGNVTSAVTPLAPIVSIRFQMRGTDAAHDLTAAGEDERVTRVSVFDTQSAGVYLTEKTDVTFRPLDLDLFDKLVKVCKAVRARIEAEQKAIFTSTIGPLRLPSIERVGFGQSRNYAFLLLAITDISTSASKRFSSSTITWRRRADSLMVRGSSDCDGRA